MPWEKNKKTAQMNQATPTAGSVYSTVGGIAAFKFKVSKDDQGQIDGYSFQQLWLKGFAL